MTDTPTVTPMGEAAFRGLAGDFVRAVEPYCEADRHALLIVFLVMFGFLIGRSPHVMAQAARHCGKLFVCLVGKTGRARKGTAVRFVRKVFQLMFDGGVDSQFLTNHTMSGLNTGEGLIYRVRDPRDDDPGVLDKRLLVDESEFGRPLSNMRKDTNNLSQTIRQAFDDDILQPGSKSNKDIAIHSHICIIEQITKEELTRLLSITEFFSGFANRFLWVWCERSKKLPDAPEVPSEVLKGIVERLRYALTYGLNADRFDWDYEGRTEWKTYYNDCPDAEDLFGALTARNEALVLRLTLLFALLDCSPGILRVEHLRAAIEVWKYCENSIKCIFEDASMFSLDNKILKFLRNAGGTGLTDTEIHNKLGNNKTGEEVHKSLASLEAQEKVWSQPESGKGRTATRWRVGKVPPFLVSSYESKGEGVVN